MTSTEILVALATETPHSSKVRCTLQHQTQEFFSKLMETINLIKDAGVKEAAATAAATAEKTEKTSNSQSSMTLTLSTDVEATIVIKKIKRS
eukprot:3702116-Amphidinium_carterae.1